MPPRPHATAIDLVADRHGERLDVFLARRMEGLTRSRAQRLIADGRVRVEGAAAKPSYRLARGERVRGDLPPPEVLTATPEAIPLDVLYEDADLIAVNKPPGMAVHPAPGHPASTLVNAILAHCRDLSGTGGPLRPGIVHRLDRDTSGVILIARNDAAHHSLARQLKERSVEKTYIALVEGTPSPAEGVIEAPLARDPRRRQRIAVVAGGRESTTSYRVVERFRGHSLVEAHPETGRTHQVRVHLAAIGHPVAGDALYGRRSTLIGRQALHALRITFAHPRTGRRMTVEAPLGDDIAAAVARLRG